MEGQGDDKSDKSGLPTTTDTDTSSPASPTVSDQTESTSTSVPGNEAFDQTQHGTNPTSNMETTEPPQKDEIENHTSSENADEVVGVTQEYKEGSSDSQSDAFEVVKMPEDGASDSVQGETTASEVQDETEKDGYMDILGNGKLKKKVITKGSGLETRPVHGDSVTLKSEGCLDDGTVVDKHHSVSFILGDGDVIQAWELAVSLMELGEECEVITAAKYAYGDVGREPDVPVDATITYTLELLQTETSPLLSSLTVSERISKGESKRERGNYLFTRKDYNGAINSYSKGLSILESSGSNTGADSSDLQELLECKLKCYNNLAACQLKIDAYDAAIRSCECVLKTQPDNVKALYRIGKAFVTKGDAEQSLPYLKRALKLDPSSKILHAELSKVMKKLKADTDSERQMYQRMMGASPEASKKPNSAAAWWKVPLMFGGVMAGVVSVGLAIAYRYNQH